MLPVPSHLSELSFSSGVPALCAFSCWHLPGSILNPLLLTQHAPPGPARSFQPCSRSQPLSRWVLLPFFIPTGISRSTCQARLSSFPTNGLLFSPRLYLLRSLYSLYLPRTGEQEVILDCTPPSLWPHPVSSLMCVLCLSQVFSFSLPRPAPVQALLLPCLDTECLPLLLAPLPWICTAVGLEDY